MSVERTTAQSYLNQLRAEQAAYAGLNYAAQQIASQNTNYTHSIVQVTTNNQTYLFIGNPIGGTNTDVVYTPLFSGGQIQTNGRFQLPAVVLNSTLVEATNKTIQPIFTNPPTVAWVELPVTNAGIVNKMRFCYAVEDLEGRVNIQKCGNTNGASGIHSRATNSEPSSIALYSLFSPQIQTDSGTTLAKSIVQRRPFLVSTDSILQLDASQTNALLSSSLGLGKYVEPETIPTGFGYVDEGKPKYGINTNLNNPSAVSDISQIITNNLPSFESSRKGGFNRGSYTKTLAANILDYNDIDSNPSVGVDYRGVDSYPFVNLLFSRYSWISGDGRSGNPVTILSRTFADLWNPSSKASVGTVNLEFRNSSGLIVGGTKDFWNEPGGTITVSIPANGHLVVETGNATYSFINGTGVVGVGSPLLFKDMTSIFDTTFSLTWNGIPVDEYRSGARRPGGNGAVLGSGDLQRKYHGNAAALNYDDGQVGDPRASYYINTYVFDRSYDENTAWGGRQFASGIADEPNGLHSFKEVKFSRWPDPSADGPNFPAVTGITIVTNQTAQYALESPAKIGNAAQNGRGTWIGFGAGTLPTAISPPPPNFPLLAPGVIANAGQLTNICELGNVFDPAQWNGIANATSIASANSGGGISLRIGQREFPAFEKVGARASQLLDLFTVATNRTNEGLINVNTASKHALRTLAAGIVYSPNGSLFPTNISIFTARSNGGDAADRFAEAVIASRPFLTPSQLSHITNSVGAYFGNSNQWGLPTEAPQMWNDQSREQLFSEILPLVSVRSRNFRVFVCGQSLSVNGKVISSVNYVFDVFLEPVSNGSQILSHMRIVYEKKY